MSVVEHDLWALTWNHPYIDPDALAAALEQQAKQPGEELDFRTRLLIRDSIRALENCWGADRTRAWIQSSSARERFEHILQSDLGPAGFPSLNKRVMKGIDPERVLGYLRGLGDRTTDPARLVIGGSITLILTGLLSRHTEDIHVVDEIPAQIRSQHEMLRALAEAFDLQLTHFQSHYLPGGWENRVRSFDTFGRLQVALVDPYDIFLSKLFSAREKDLKDLRVLKPQLDSQRLTDRLLDTTTALLAEPPLRHNAQSNWYILFGQPLPERKQP
jgi:hypothetical protein